MAKKEPTIEELTIELHEDANDSLDDTYKAVRKDVNSLNDETLGVILLAIPAFTRLANKTNNARYDTLTNKVSRLRRDALSKAESTFRYSTKDITSKEAAIISEFFGTAVKSNISELLKYGTYSGLKYNDWWTKLGESDTSRIIQSVRFGVNQGQTAKEILTEVKRKFKTTDNGTKMLVRTVGNGLINESRKEEYKQAGITTVQYSAILDGRTSDICLKLDGKIAPIDEIETPPMHPNCRSTLIPIIPK